MKYVTTFLVLLLVYMLLAGFYLQELIVGVAISMILTLVIAKYVDYRIDYKFPIRLLVFVFAYLPIFIWQLILANIDVARRVLSPTIPLKPGFVKVETELKGDFSKLMLANSITLTPGTLSVDIDGQDLYVHTVEVKGQTKEEQRKHISSLFEKWIGVIFK